MKVLKLLQLSIALLLVSGVVVVFESSTRGSVPFNGVATELRAVFGLSDDNNQGQVLSAGSNLNSLSSRVAFNIPATFRQDVTLKQGLEVDGRSTFRDDVTVVNKNVDLGTGELTASNVVYEIEAGPGISVTGDPQRPTITSNAVSSVQGQAGAVSLVAGNGIAVNGLTIVNTSPNQSQNVFQNISIGGQQTITANNSTDTLTFAGAGGITLTTDPQNKTVTISTEEQTPSGLVDEGSVVTLQDPNDSVGIGTSNPGGKLGVSSAGEQLRLIYSDGISYNSFAVDLNGDLTITPSGGDVNVTGNINAGNNTVIGGSFTGQSGSGVTVGSPTTTGLTVLTDGSGNNEVVLPDGSIASTEILDSSILPVDLSAINLASGGNCLTYDAGTSQFAWMACAAGNPWTDGVGLTYLTDLAEDFAVGGTTLASAFSVDVSANTVRVGTGVSSNAIISMNASDGDTGNIEYTTNDSIYFSGVGAVGFNTPSPDAELEIVSTTAQLRLTYTDNSVYSSFVVNNDGDLSITPTGGDVIVGGNVNAGSNSMYAAAFAPVGSSALTIGSGTTTSITISTNGTGDGEVVLPDGSIGSTEILDSTVLEVDLSAIDAPSDNECLTYDQTSGGFEWNACAAGASNPWTDGSGITYLTDTAEDMAVGGSTLASAFSVDVSANTTRIGSGSVANAVLSMFASDGDTGTITYTTNDEWSFSGGTITSDGNINIGNNTLTAATWDGSGAVGLTIGSNDVTSLTVTTDGTGNSEVVLPNESISSTEIMNDTLLEVDLAASNSASNGQCLTYNNGTGGFTWTNCDTGGASAFTDGGTIVYLTDTTDDFAIGGSTLAAAFSVDTSANTTRLGTGATANAVLSMYASNGSTGDVTYTTNDSWNFSGGSVGINTTGPDAQLDV
ncbi:hypothetical protein HGA91_00005, partial [candidate division WWE3 bacterium]|nr:hypothetical protein [candidate division WWE3 bacterium]